MGKKFRKVKMRELLGWDKDPRSLLYFKVKQKLCIQTKQNNKSIHYFPSAGRYSASSRKAGLIKRNGYFEDKFHHSECPLFFLLSFYYCVFLYGMEQTFGRFEFAAPVVSSHNFQCTLSLLTSGQSERERRLLSNN